VKTAIVQCDNAKPISCGGLDLLATHFASKNYIIALRILNFILRPKDSLTAINSSLYNVSSFVLWRPAA